MIKKATINALRNNEDNAYEDLYCSIWDRLCVSAFSVLNNQQDAEDAAQDTMLQVYSNLGQLPPSDYFENWLRQLLMESCINILRENNSFMPETVPIQQCTNERDFRFSKESMLVMGAA